MTTLLKNGNIDIYIVDGVITAVGNDALGIQIADTVIDCTGFTVIPGICDIHVHLRDPGQTHKEDLISGANAAAAGGVTAIVCMPNTKPTIDMPELVQDIVERSASVKVKIYPCAAITKGLKGEELSNTADFRALKKAGAVAVSDDGMPVANAQMMLGAMEFANEAELMVISHCEDLNLIDTRMSENTVTVRDVNFAYLLNAPVHIAHVSTKEAVNYIRKEKRRGAPVSCEVAPHHFTLTLNELLKRDADYKMNPPLRRKDDITALIEALCDGTVDCIASDHAPHAPSEKIDFESAPNGVLGLETILSVTLTQLYHTGKLSLEKIVELLCVNPRRILGIEGGKLEPGSPADIAVVDLNEEWIVEPDRLHSKSRNTCFKEMKLKGRVKYTLVDGKVEYKF